MRCFGPSSRANRIRHSTSRGKPRGVGNYVSFNATQVTSGRIPFMYSLRELYRTGHGPSSSHTMGPANAASSFRHHFPQAQSFRVHLFGSLAATGLGHQTDVAIESVLEPLAVDF